MRWYWLTFRALPVTVHLDPDRLFRWQRICGVQIGRWFFGAIRGTAAALDPPAPPPVYCTCDANGLCIPSAHAHDCRMSDKYQAKGSDIRR